jgi:hypothetical protein
MEGLVAIEIYAGTGNLCVLCARAKYCGDAGSNEVRAGRNLIVTAIPATLAGDERQRAKLAEFLRDAPRFIHAATRQCTLGLCCNTLSSAER